MANLTANELKVAYSEFARVLILDGVGSLTKPNIKAFLNDASNWVDSNQASYNAALTNPAKSTLTAIQKAEGLRAVLKAKYPE